MNLRENTPRMMEALRRCTSFPARARIVPTEESEKLAERVRERKTWLDRRDYLRGIRR